MKTIGLIGGMSWESSLEYYRIINEEVKNILGGSHSAKCLMYSFDFQEVEKLQHESKWGELEKEMILQSNNLKKAGADFIVICTNTMHLMAPQIEKVTGLNVLHIADVTAEEIIQEGLDKVALLGTNFTMEGTFYREILEKKYNIEVIIPSKEDREIVHNIIYNELVKGIISDFSRKKYLAIIKKLEKEGAQGVILGCTEIPLLVKQSQVSIPVFDTTDIHSKASVKYALED